jgi:hypothetical protein
MKQIFLAACMTAALFSPLQAKPNTEAGWLRCGDFQRSPDGSWTTKRDALVQLPGGNATIHANTTLPATGTYMGVQFGFLLGQECGSAPRR